MVAGPPTWVDAVWRLLLSPPSVSPERASELLKGLPGRGGYVPRLQQWLEGSRAAFPEPFTVKDLDGLQDHGVDLLLEGARTKARVGFQVKSDRDLREKDFSQRLKAQVLEAQSYGIEKMIVIFACSLTKRNVAAIKSWLSFTLRHLQPGILCLEPERAAALYELFDRPVEKLDLPEQGWVEFFSAVGQPQLAPRYLDPWPGLLPDQRFLAPEALPSIRRSLEEHRLTILAGPPASGKTFTAAQLLWEAFRSGRPVRWLTAAEVEATEGPIPADGLDPRGRVEMRGRVDALVRHLGHPVDEHDLVSRVLAPGALVYIEDPFGKTDEEYGLSLASYNFFDLQRMLDMLEESAARAGCRVLITSRERLFRRWLADLERQGRPRPKASVVLLSSDSYPPGPLYEHLLLLAGTRGLSEPEEIAEVLVNGIQMPFEADTLVRGLNPGDGVDQAARAVAEWRGDLRAKIAGRLTPRTESETLFLLFIDAMSSGGGVYGQIHEALQLPGEPRTSYEAALHRFGPFLVPEGSDQRKSHSYLPAHSIIGEAIREQLAAPEQRALLCRVARLLPMMKREAPASGSRFNLGRAFVTSNVPILGQLAFSLLRLGVVHGGEEEESALGKILFDEGGLAGREYWLMALWPQLTPKFQERFFERLNSKKERAWFRLEQAAARLPFSRMGAPDAWRLVGLLLEVPRRLRSKMNPYMSPWSYLFLHLNDAPGSLLTKLDDWANEDPVSFLYALDDQLLLAWDYLAELPKRLILWRSCFFDPRCLGRFEIQESVLMTIAQYWNRAPHALKEVFDFSSSSPKAELRSVAGGQALFHFEDYPDLEPFALATLSDPDPSVPLGAFRWGRGDDIHQRFAEGLLEKASPGLAAEMALHLLEDLRETVPPWQKNLLARCQSLAGDAVRAAAIFASFEGRKRPKLLGYEPAESPFAEPEIVQAAWLWAHLNSLRARPKLSDDELLRLLRELTDPQIRGGCLFYVSYQLTALPESVHQFLEELSEASEEDAEAIRDGTKWRQPESSRTTLRFLISELLPA